MLGNFIAFLVHWVNSLNETCAKSCFKGQSLHYTECYPDLSFYFRIFKNMKWLLTVNKLLIYKIVSNTKILDLGIYIKKFPCL